MFNHLKGIVAHKSPSRVVVEVGGVGYDVTVPLSVGRRMPDTGKEARILTHLVVKEDELRLIGFLDDDERTLFRRLVELSGVGPSMALQILSCMTPQEFALAIERQDADALRKIKGVGEKMAKRIILELKGSKTLLPQDGADIPAGVQAEACLALVALGLSQNEAAARVEKAVAANPGGTLEDLVKAALR